jgi:CRISPR-associated protein Csm4
LKLFVMTLEPQGALGTPLKGDTLFGHFCWQVHYDATLLNGGLERQLHTYADTPFAVFSSAYPLLQGDPGYYALKRPDLPLSRLFPPGDQDRVQQMRQRKNVKKKQWMLVPTDLRVDLRKVEYLSDRELQQRLLVQVAPELRRRLAKLVEPVTAILAAFSQSHNTIHRLTQTTGPAPFAPYEQTIWHYHPGTKLAVFVLIDPGASDGDRVRTGLERIGQWGYGRDASIGLGRFRVTGCQELPLPQAQAANACYTLAPAVPALDSSYEQAYFLPLVRFGKHGDLLARASNPFKNPVLMADEGAVFLSRNLHLFDRPYLGRAVTGISKAQPQTVMQGYSFYLPFRLEA